MSHEIDNFSLRECVLDNCLEIGLDFKKGILLADRFDRPKGFEVVYYKDPMSRQYLEILDKSLHQYQSTGAIELVDGIVGDVMIRSNENLQKTEKQLNSVILFVMRTSISRAQVMTNSQRIG